MEMLDYAALTCFGPVFEECVRIVRLNRVSLPNILQQLTTFLLKLVLSHQSVFSQSIEIS